MKLLGRYKSQSIRKLGRIRQEYSAYSLLLQVEDVGTTSSFATLSFAEVLIILLKHTNKRRTLLCGRIEDRFLL